MDEQEINLEDLVKVLIRRKITIFVVFAVAVLISGIKVISKKPVYESRVAVLITPSRLQAILSQTKFSLADLQGRTTELKPTFSLDTHIAFLKSTIVLEGIISQLKLNLTPSELLEGLKLEKENSANVINLVSQSAIPELARDIANVWAEKYIQLVEDTLSHETKGTSSLIIGQFKLTKKELREAEERLNRFKNESRLDLMKKDLEVIENKLFEAQKRIIELKSDLQTRQTQIEELGKELSKQEKFVVVSKAIADEALWSKIAQQGKEKEWLEKSRLKTEQVNPIYTDLENKLITARTDAKVLQSQKTYFENLIEDLQKQVNKSKETINNKDLEFTQMSREVEDKRETYKQLYDKNEEARIAESIIIGEVKIISPAFLPQASAMSRKKYLLFGAGLGILLGIVAAFLREFWERIKSS